MEHLSKIAVILLFASIAFADGDLTSLQEKSSELQAAFKQCGFCPDKRRELQSFNEDQLIPALERSGKAIQKRPDSHIAKVIIDIALTNKDSAAEGFSYALGDAYLADSKSFLRLVGNLKSLDNRKFIFDQTDWGIQNHTDLPKEKVKKLLSELKAFRAKNIKEK